jgi:hypothetical protein
MFLPTTTILIVALGAGTLALPADSTSLISPSILEERAFKTHGLGSIAGFKEPDCTKDPVGDRPLDLGLLKGEDNCIIFSSDMANMIGINWGDTGHYIVNSLFVYSDTTCTKRVDSIEAKKMRKRGKGPSTNSCVSQKDHGGPWGSVKYIHEPICSDADVNNGKCTVPNVSSLWAREPEPSALALPDSDDDPTKSTSPFNLEERAFEKRGMGSIATFKLSDCTGNPDDKPKKDPGNNDCITMTSGTHAIGFNWGNSEDEYTTRAIAFYKDDKCTVSHSTFTPAGQSLVVRKKGRATNACIAPPPLENPFNSVQLVH